ncbi:hypothetical protein BpHYR1_050849 [Brachionus plicatilis]|uniref:Uncharacterized protein n=1 Tax=Brachionus plicatilis TaxID=10195 RepID=A0A3M7SB94_BRAPC|nr:hypothetical protein BpHYR1_050849 [Brachionus plicatilis]
MGKNTAISFVAPFIPKIFFLICNKNNNLSFQKRIISITKKFYEHISMKNISMKRGSVSKGGLDSLVALNSCGLLLGKRPFLIILAIGPFKSTTKLGSTFFLYASLCLLPLVCMSLALGSLNLQSHSLQ